MARPVFLVRDPVRVFDSWKHIGWADMQSFIDCYTQIFQMLDQEDPSCANSSSSCLLYERLTQEPQLEVQRLCARWGVPYSEAMLEFQKPWGSSRNFPIDRDRATCCEEEEEEEKVQGLFTTVRASSCVLGDVPTHNLLSNSEKDRIEEHVGRQYLRCWQDDVLRLQAAISKKSWVGFDLDDTLHEFRLASSNATTAVLEEISRQYDSTGTGTGTTTTPVSMPALKDQYSKVLQANTASAFSDRKTSFDYRKERFCSVLAHFSLPYDAQFVTRLLEIYEATLVASLEPKCGALGLLSTLKSTGKKIVVITEGPQDAQERTVAALGISGYIDFLVTTNHFRLSKADGLFAKVLQHLDISSGDIVYIGDSEQRDMEPAMAEGIFSIHLAEAKNVCLTSHPPRVNTLRKLQYIISPE
ncbi:Haloacid dehalogenase-like hydrolase [Xylariales sp. PMI_506]|nr:Haloacid dehalogenase-like hydrolase [Xylariales sp. PMI_506]